jgi:hypothetical protein
MVINDVCISIIIDVRLIKRDNVMDGRVGMIQSISRKSMKERVVVVVIDVVVMVVGYRARGWEYYGDEK